MLKGDDSSKWSFNIIFIKINKLLFRQTSLDLVGTQREWLEKDDKDGAKHQVKETFLFLSDPSPIIGYACHLLTNWLTDSLTD